MRKCVERTKVNHGVWGEVKRRDGEGLEIAREERFKDGGGGDREARGEPRICTRLVDNGIIQRK